MSVRVGVHVYVWETVVCGSVRVSVNECVRVGASVYVWETVWVCEGECVSVRA